MPIGIIIADDHWIFRHGLRFLLENEGFTVLGEASNGHEAVKLTEKFRPDVVVMDFSMPQLNGLDAAKEIRRVSPRSKVILLTAHREQHYVLEALSVGVKGYVLKSEGATMVGEAIQEVNRGNAYLSPGIARFAVDSFVGKCADGPVEVLSPRELQVLQLVAESNTTKKIAELLNLTVKAAESCRTALMGKLDIHETASLVRYAVRRGIVKA
ncbi:MAG TPA: response regulator transcription factor [Candidatus Acidoferrales bacterium]|nr:response regulator transcription factor [Candidatus Acidoferrales bacterium]